MNEITIERNGIKLRFVPGKPERRAKQATEEFLCPDPLTSPEDLATWAGEDYVQKALRAELSRLAKQLSAQCRRQGIFDAGAFINRLSNISGATRRRGLREQLMSAQQNLEEVKARILDLASRGILPPKDLLENKAALQEVFDRLNSLWQDKRSHQKALRLAREIPAVLAPKPLAEAPVVQSPGLKPLSGNFKPLA